MIQSPVIDMLSPNYCLSLWYHAMGKGDISAKIVLDFIDEYKMDGKLRQLNTRENLFDLRAFNAETKTDWRYTQHNIRMEEEHAYRNMTFYILVTSGKVQLMKFSISVRIGHKLSSHKLSSLERPIPQLGNLAIILKFFSTYEF